MTKEYTAAPAVLENGTIWPGLLLAAAIAGATYPLRRIPGVSLLSPIILAMVIGMILHNAIGTPAWAKPGIRFAFRKVLRFGIIILGLQLTAAQLVEIGWRGLIVMLLTLVAAFVVTKWLGARLGVDRKLTELIAAGTAICGASAIIATNTVTNAKDEDVAYAVACVTLFGSIAMFVYPLLTLPLGLDAARYGLWAGASIHEVAQVVGAAFQNSAEAGHLATIVKLSRVVMLAPMVIAIAFLARRAQGKAGIPLDKAPPLPWFVLGFVACMAFSSLVTIPPAPMSWIAQLTTFLLAVSLAAMGLEINVAKLHARGSKCLLLGAASTLFIAGFSLLLVALIG